MTGAFYCISIAVTSIVLGGGGGGGGGVTGISQKYLYSEKLNACMQLLVGINWVLFPGCTYNIFTMS